ncbi:hypothetical protein KCU78_g6320, partial [Aureobasidium melanogenum]
MAIYSSTSPKFFLSSASTSTTAMSTTKKLKRYLELDSSLEDEIPSKKKKQLSRRTCLVCDVEEGTNQFPNHKKVSSHEHDHNVCDPCYRSHLENEIDSKGWNEVACPECSIMLTYKEVKNMTTAENFAKYEQACIRATLAADPDFRYCLSTTCKSGQLHPGGTDEPIFRCEHCGHKHCIVCEANWHQDQTCEEFQAVRRRLHAENERSQQEVKKLSKPCPGCRVPIQKNRGCDHMRCSRCRHEFCWVCSADYGLIFREGNHRHEKNCIHYRANPRAQEPELPRNRIERMLEPDTRLRADNRSDPDDSDSDDSDLDDSDLDDSDLDDNEPWDDEADLLLVYEPDLILSEVRSRAPGQTLSRIYVG